MASTLQVHIPDRSILKSGGSNLILIFSLEIPAFDVNRFDSDQTLT